MAGITQNVTTMKIKQKALFSLSHNKNSRNVLVSRGEK